MTKRIQVIVRDDSFQHCRPKVLDFTIEGAAEDIKTVLHEVKLKFSEPMYKMELTSEETIYHSLKPDLTIATA